MEQLERTIGFRDLPAPPAQPQGLRKQLWETSSMLVRQLPDIGDVGSVALKAQQLSSLEAR